MRKFLVVIAFALSGCQNGQFNQSVITQVQQIAVQICGFLPTVETVANIIAPGISVIPSQVATAICAAVKPAGVSVAPGTRFQGSAVPMVGNVPVQGVFVK